MDNLLSELHRVRLEIRELSEQESALKNKYVKVGYKISLRVISSLIAIFIFNYIKTDGSESTLRQIVSYSMIAFFFYVLTLKN